MRSDAIELPAKPLLVIVSGPSGVGKDAVLSRLKDKGLPLSFIITATTRLRRPNEQDNVHYYFVTRAQFEEMIAKNEMLEYATVYGNYYGVPVQPVKEALAKGRDVVVKVDVQGAATIKNKVPQAITIFLTTPSREDLQNRLKGRSTETEEEYELRCRTAEMEMKTISGFDYIVYNRQGEIDKAAADITAIITAEKSRINRQEVKL